MTKKIGLILLLAFPFTHAADICSEEPMGAVLSSSITRTAAIAEQKKSERNFFSYREAHGLDLTATNEKKVGKISIELGTGSQIFNLGISGSIDDKGQGDIVDNKGIQTDGGKITFGYTHLMLEPIDQNQLLPFINEQDADIAKSCKALKKCHEDNAGDEAKKCKKQQTAYEKASKYALPGDFNILKKFNFVAFKGSYGRNEFKYFDLDNNKFADTQKEEGYDLSTSFGSINYGNKSRWEIGIVYKNEYKFGKKNKERNICRELPENSDFQECFNARLMPPTESSSTTIFYEYSKIFADPNRILKGLAVKSSYNNDDKFSLELPLYLFEQKDSGIISGIEFGWKSDPKGEENAFQAGVFFSMPLTLNREL